MIKPAFSTVACPEWTLEQVAANAARYGFEAVELRTFGETSSRLACDPALSAEEKTRGFFHDAGVEILSLGTSVSFDEPINPPVIGLAIGDTEKTVRAGKRAVDMAVALECPFIRVFGFEIPPRERRASALDRMARRLRMVADHAARTGVRLTVENGGSFTRALDLAELLAAVDNPLVGASYSIASGAAEGDTPAGAVSTLSAKLWIARIKDFDANRRPCALGQGKVPCREFVGALATSGFDGPLVFEWDRLWLKDLAAPDTVLPAAAKQLFHWIAEFSGSPAVGSNSRPVASGR